MYSFARWLNPQGALLLHTAGKSQKVGDVISFAIASALISRSLKAQGKGSPAPTRRVKRAYAMQDPTYTSHREALTAWIKDKQARLRSRATERQRQTVVNGVVTGQMVGPTVVAVTGAPQ